MPGIAPAAIRGGLIATLLLLLSACQTELFSALPEVEANEMVAILMQGGLDASKTKAKDGTDTVLIEKTQFAQAVDLLRAHGYPRHKFSSMGDVFEPSGLVASPMQEQARFLWALGQELSATVSEIDGVLTARVQVVLPDNDLLKRDPISSSASVFIRYDDQSAVATLLPQIKALVANSVQGLSYDKVSVVLVPVRHAQPPEPSQEAALLDGQAGKVAVSSATTAAGGLGQVLRQRFAALLDAVRPRTQPSRLPDAAEQVILDRN